MIRRAAVLASRSCTSRVVTSSSARTSSINYSSSTTTRLIHQQRCGIDAKNINNNNNGSSHHRSFSSFSSSPSKSLKKVIRPFLVACHPDLMHAAEKESAKNKHPLSSQAKDVNLKAVQTINGLIDNLEDLIGRCTPPSYLGQSSSSSSSGGYKSAGSLPELKAKYEIEFILPSQTNNNINDDNKPTKKKHYERESLTLRSITMEFPEHLRSSVRKWALTSFPDRSSKLHTDPDYEPHPQEVEAFRVAIQLRQHATTEFVRLLTISGMEAPKSSFDGMQDKSRFSGQLKDESRWTLSDHFLHEMGINPMEDIADPSSQQQTSAFFGRMQPKQSSTTTCSFTKVQQKRQAFMQKIPWEKFRANYDQAFLDAQADCTTAQLKLFNPNTVEGRERRERLVSQICSNVRIVRAKQEDMDENDDDEFDDIPEGLDVVAQLIAIRRLNLILSDNFDYLQMERMGRMWENLCIVLLPPRGTRRRSQRKVDPRHANSIHPGRKLNKWERRMKRRERMKPVSRGQMRHVADKHFNPIPSKESEAEADEEELQKEKQQYYLESESGFKFSYGTRADQGSGHVTAYIPVDFGDDELVRQLYSHLYDYFDNCCGDMGFLSYGADGEVSANLTRDIERENGMDTENMGAEEKMGT
jgi:hypothetical protein